MEYLTAQNSYPLREWHFEHMQKTIIRYVTGISEDSSSFQKRLHKRYNGNLTYVSKNIAFDIKHGVTNDQVLAFLGKIKNDLSYADKQNSDSRERIESLEKHFTASPLLPKYLQYLVH